MIEGGRCRRVVTRRPGVDLAPVAGGETDDLADIGVQVPRLEARDARIGEMEPFAGRDIRVPEVDRHGDQHDVTGLGRDRSSLRRSS